MKTWHVTYYYLATGMEGNADTRDHGFVDAETADEAKKIVASREYREGDWEHKWLVGCLTATERKLFVVPAPPPVTLTIPRPDRELLKKYMRLVIECEGTAFITHLLPNEAAHYAKDLVFTEAEIKTLKEIEKEIDDANT